MCVILHLVTYIATVFMTVFIITVFIYLALFTVIMLNHILLAKAQLLLRQAVLNLAVWEWWYTALNGVIQFKTAYVTLVESKGKKSNTSLPKASSQSRTVKQAHYKIMFVSCHQKRFWQLFCSLILWPVEAYER